MYLVHETKQNIRTRRDKISENSKFESEREIDGKMLIQSYEKRGDTNIRYRAEGGGTDMRGRVKYSYLLSRVKTLSDV